MEEDWHRLLEKFEWVENSENILKSFIVVMMIANSV